jgi:hypothetical protein
MEFPDLPSAMRPIPYREELSITKTPEIGILLKKIPNLTKITNYKIGQL